MGVIATHTYWLKKKQAGDLLSYSYSDVVWWSNKYCRINVIKINAPYHISGVRYKSGSNTNTVWSNEGSHLMLYFILPLTCTVPSYSH